MTERRKIQIKSIQQNFDVQKKNPTPMVLYPPSLCKYRATVVSFKGKPPALKEFITPGIPTRGGWRPVNKAVRLAVPQQTKTVTLPDKNLLTFNMRKQADMNGYIQLNQNLI